MPASQKVVPSSPINSSISSSVGPGDHNLEGIILSNFKLKPAGTGATRNTLVENDSLSSYSWPEETNRQNGAKRQAEEKTKSGASGNESTNGKGAISPTTPKGATVINIENDQHEPLQEPTFVESYMKFMYWTCVSPFSPTGNWYGPCKMSRSDFVLNVIQKICFATIIGFSSVKSFFQVKFFLLYYMEYPNLENFIDMMFYIMNAGTKVYYVYLFVMQQKLFIQMLKSLYKLRAFRTQGSSSASIQNYRTVRYALKLGISSMMMSVIQTTWYSGIRQWTPQKGILYYSSSTAFGLLVWSKENIGNDTLYEELRDEYEREQTSTNFLLGAFGMLIHFCSSLHNDATADLMQAHAETVKEEMQCLQNKIVQTANDEHNVTLAGFFRENGEWAHSQLLTRAMNNCNDTLDPLMKYKHVNNLIVYVFFVLNFLDGEYPLAFLAYLLYTICKTSYTYRIAAEASVLNEEKRAWIRRLAWKSNDNEFLKRVSLLLEEIKENPIGMGKGQFMINESFLYRFLGWVGSVFVLQAQSREAKSD